MDDHLVGYIKEALQKNFSEDHIREKLKEAGFHDQDIDIALLDVYKNLGAVPVHPKVVHSVRSMVDHNVPDNEIVDKLAKKGIAKHFAEYALKEAKAQKKITEHKQFKRLHLPQ